MDQPIGLDNLASSDRSLWKKCNIAMMIVVGVMIVEVGFLSQVDLFWAGDSFSDTNVLLAGENFSTYGFSRLRYLPVHQYGEPGATPSYYLHYPPLPDLINGVLQKAGIHSIAVMRLFSGLLFVVGFIFLYRVIGSILNPFVAVCGIAWMPGTLFFIRYCNSLHCHSYHVFLLGLYLYSIRGVLETKRPISVVLCWLSLFLISLISFEFILFCSVFTLFYFFVSRQRKGRLLLFGVLITAPMTGLLLHFVQNIWAVGLSGALSDNMGFNSRNGNNMTAQLDSLRILPFHLTTLSQKYFHIDWLCICVVCFLVFVQVCGSKSSFCSEKAVAFFVGLILGSFMWYSIMPSHTIAHEHVISQLLILFMIAMGYVVAQLIFRIANRKENLLVRLIFTFFICILFLNNAYRIRLAFKQRPPMTRCLSRIIGPDACPENAAIIRDYKLRGRYWPYFLKRPSWIHPQKVRITDEWIDMLRPSIAEKYHIYYLYYGLQNCTKDPIFAELAGRYSGKSYTYEVPGAGQETIVLFDIDTALTRNVALDENVARQQREGIFSPWVIDGFQTRLQAEMGWKTKK